MNTQRANQRADDLPVLDELRELYAIADTNAANAERDEMRAQQKRAEEERIAALEPQDQGGNRPGATATAHLVSRPIDTSNLPWYGKALAWLTGASHSGWIVETKGGVYLVEGGCSTCDARGRGGNLEGYVTRFDNVAGARQAFSTERNVEVTDHGQWAVQTPDVRGIVGGFNEQKITYDWGGTNSNYFAFTFGEQAGIRVTPDPTGSAFLPGPWLYQWGYSPPTKVKE